MAHGPESGGSYSAVHVPPSPALMVQRPVKLLLQAVVQFLPWGTQGQAPQGRLGTRVVWGPCSGQVCGQLPSWPVEDQTFTGQVA